MPDWIEAESEAAAFELAERLLNGWVAEIMRDYAGPRWTDPTGLSSLVASVRAAVPKDS